MNMGGGGRREEQMGEETRWNEGEWMEGYEMGREA